MRDTRSACLTRNNLCCSAKSFKPWRPEFFARLSHRSARMVGGELPGLAGKSALDRAEVHQNTEKKKGRSKNERPKSREETPKEGCEDEPSPSRSQQECTICSAQNTNDENAELHSACRLAGIPRKANTDFPCLGRLVAAFAASAGSGLCRQGAACARPTNVSRARKKRPLEERTAQV